MELKQRGSKLIAATLILGGAILASHRIASGDTLILRDGRKIDGEVERTDAGYRVKTPNGPVNVNRGDVVEWKRAGGATAPVQGTATRPATAPASAANTADRTKRTVDVLVAHGGDALALGDFRAARDLLVDAIQLDPRNRQALEYLGYCYLRLDDIPRATRSMEAAVAGNSAPGRATTINLAYSLLRNRNPMRGAKMIKDYLAANSAAPLDEEALNAFAICLGQSSDEARLHRFWTECVTFYDQYNAKLEATKSGQKRWGVSWMPQAEWAIIDGKNKAIQRQMDSKWKDLQSATKAFQQAKAEYQAAYSASRFRKNGPSPASIEPRVRSTKERADRLQAEYDELSSRYIRPTLPKLFDPVAMEIAPVAIASATGAGTPATGTPGTTSTPGAISPAVQPAPAVTPPPTDPRPAPQPQPEPPVAVAPQPSPSPEPSPSAQTRTRTVFLSACGFAVGPDLIVTSAACVEGATRVSVQPADSDPLDAEVVRTDAASGLALVRLKVRRMAYLPVADTFNGGPIQCVSFPTPSIFDPVSEVIPGTSVPPKEGWSIRLLKHPRLAGAPILAGGKVVGVQLATRDNDATTLPSVTLDTLRKFVGDLPLQPTVPDPTVAVYMVTALKEK